MATKAGAKKSGRAAKPVKGEEAAPPAATADHERDYLLRRISSLEALVEENLGLLRRIAALDVECAALRTIIAEGRSGGAEADAAEPPPPPPQPKLVREAEVTKAAARSAAAAQRKEKQLAQERARTIEALLDLSVIEAIERRRQRPKETPSVLLVGEAQYLAGKGPALARQEIRDILNGVPERASLTLMAIKPPSSVGEEAETPILREGAETVELLMPAAAEIDYILTSLAPDIVMNVGPLGPVADVFRFLPGALRHAGVLNLLHGECGALGAADAAGRLALAKVGAALVTTDIERQLLLKLGFEGEITTYVRGVNVPQTKVTGLAGNGTIACILEGAGRDAASFIAEVTVGLDAIGERLVALHEGPVEEENGAFADLQSRRPADLVKSLGEADAVLMPPGTTGLPQALQVAMTMGKVCLLPQDPFGRQALEALPGVRYPAEAARLVDIVRDFLANREIYSDLAERTALYARKHFRRGDWAKVLNGFLSARLPAKAT
jgi:hypothetical protein